MTSSSFWRAESLQWLFGALLLILAVVAVFPLPFANEDRDYSQIPSISVDEFEQRSDDLWRTMNAPPTDDPADYFRAVVELDRLAALQQKLRAEGTLPEVMIPTHADIGGFQISYLDRFDDETLFSLSQEMTPWMNAERAKYTAPTSPTAWLSAVGWFLQVIACSVFVAFAFFATRLRAEGLLILPELVWRLPASALTWPFALWRYPSRIDPLAQVRRMRQYLAGVTAMLVSMSPLSAAHAQSSKGPIMSSADTEYVVTEAPKSPIALSGAIGVTSQKMTANGAVVHDGPIISLNASASYDGWTLGYAQTRAVSGDRGSDENDYTLSKSWKVDEATVTVTGAYYDIQPLNSDDGGDMVSPIVSIERPVGDGITLFAVGEAYFMTGGPAGKNGFDVKVGAKTSRTYHGINFDLALAGVYAEGPFQKDPGFLLRSDASASISLTSRVRAVLSGKFFAPIIGARDREPAGSLTAGVALAF